MRHFCSLCHILIFLIITWIIYNSILIPWMILSINNTEDPRGIGRVIYLVYFLGLKEYELFQVLWTVFLRPFYSGLINFISMMSALLMIAGIPVYLWCRKQTPLRACLMAMIGGILGPCIIFAVVDFIDWIYAMVITFLFYIGMAAANTYRRKYLPDIRLPAWLEWREPELVPPIVDLWKMFCRLFRRRGGL